jgi:hypothetical protein
MPNGFDFDFEEAYGKPFNKMTRQEKDMAMMNQLYYVRKRIDSLKWLERLGWIGAVAIPVIVGWLGWLTELKSN